MSASTMFVEPDLFGEELRPFDSAPPAGPSAAAPDRKPPEPEPDPVNAPLGYTYSRDNGWRPRKPAGRPKKIPPPPPVAPVTEAVKKPEPVKKETNYRPIIGQSIEGLYLVGAATPIPDTAFGYALGAIRTRIRVTVGVLAKNVNELAEGGNAIANHVPFLAEALDRVKEGRGGIWVLPVAMLLAPIAAQLGQLWSRPVGQAETDAAEQVEADVKAYFEQMAAVPQPPPGDSP